MLMEIFDVTLFYVPFDGNVLEGGNCVKNRIRYKDGFSKGRDGSLCVPVYIF